MYVGMFFEEGRSPFQPGHRQLLHHGFHGSMRYWFSSYIRILITRNLKRHTRVLLEVCRVPTKHLALFCFLIMKQYYITAYHLYKQTMMNCIRSQRQFSKKEITNFVTCIVRWSYWSPTHFWSIHCKFWVDFRPSRVFFPALSIHWFNPLSSNPCGTDRVGSFSSVTTELWDDGELERCVFFRLGPKTLSSCAGEGKRLQGWVVGLLVVGCWVSS